MPIVALIAAVASGSTSDDEKDRLAVEAATGGLAILTIAVDALVRIATSLEKLAECRLELADGGFALDARDGGIA